MNFVYKVAWVIKTECFYAFYSLIRTQKTPQIVHK